MAKHWSWFNAWGEDFVQKGFIQVLYLGDNEGNKIIEAQLNGSPVDLTVKMSHADKLAATPLMHEALEGWSKLLTDKVIFCLLAKIEGVDEVIKQTARALSVARKEK